MDHRVLASFLDELEKIAVTPQQLRGIGLRLGAATGGPKEAFEAYTKITPISRRVRNRLNIQDIIVGPKHGLRRMPGASPRQLQLLNNITKAHEGFERKAINTGIRRPFSTHHHPDVLLQEHNLVSSLKPGGQYTQQDIDLVRSALTEKRLVNVTRRRGKPGNRLDSFLPPGRKVTSSEPVDRSQSGMLKNLLVRQFKDPRAAQFLEPGAKVPRAMRKRFRELY